MIIYKITNQVNSKIYIGQDKHNNPNYLGSGKILHLAFKKYGFYLLQNHFRRDALL
jgi:CRISPR/Cas system-associated endonuclease/helicase Cas3